jgi:SAM-dependent methyltransferase
MVSNKIQAEIESIEKNIALYEEANFDSRADAIDYIEFNVIDRIEGLLQTTNQPEKLIQLKQDAERIKRQLEDIDDNLFRRLQGDIQKGVLAGDSLKTLLMKYTRSSLMNSKQWDEFGYDNLDIFMNGLLLSDTLPAETKVRETGMLYYQQTPARIILELIKKANLARKDVVYDLGSGLGQVSMLVSLLSEADTKGVEFEPAYCDYARERAAELNLSRVKFINVDAREADYSDGTIFYMYTPFEGRILQDVLERLRRESQKRSIRLFSYGACTLQVSRQNWLTCLNQAGNQIYKLGEFRSL